MPLVSAESLASNVAKVRPMIQVRAPTASVPTSAAVVASVPSTEATKYQNVNVNINGVVKNLLIPLSESQTITKAATVHTTTSTAKSIPVHTTTPTTLSSMHHQVIRMGPKVEGSKTLSVLPPGLLPQQITPRARLGAPTGNHILLQVPNPNAPDKFKYVLIQQPPTVKTLPQSAPPVKVAVSSSEGLKGAQQKLTSVLHRELVLGCPLKQTTTKVVYPGLNKSCNLKDLVIPPTSAATSASSGTATKMAASKPLKIDSVFSLTQQTATTTSTPTFPTFPGVIEIKPEPMDTGYEPIPPVQIVDPPKPQWKSITERLLKSTPSTSGASAPENRDYEVLAEWEARPDSQTQSSGKEEPRKHSKLLGPDFAKKKALRRKSKGIKFPIISYSRPPQKRSQGYRIKRSTVDLERLDELLADIQQYVQGKTLRRAAALERRVMKARTRRIQKTEQKKRRKRLAKKRRLEKSQTSPLTTQTASLTKVTSVPNPSESFSSPQMLALRKATLATAAGANKPALVSPESQTVSVDKRKYLMVKTAAGSFLVPVSPGMGGSNTNKAPPVTAFQAVGPSMKLGPGGTKLVPSENSTEPARPTRNQPTTTTPHSQTSASVSTGSAESTSANSSASPAEEQEENVPREERIRLLREKLKKQQEEMESAHRLHEKAKSALESIDLL